MGLALPTQGLGPFARYNGTPVALVLLPQPILVLTPRFAISIFASALASHISHVSPSLTLQSYNFAHWYHPLLCPFLLETFA